MKEALSTEKRQKMTENARNMFSFSVGQKVSWNHGRYDYYFVQSGFKDSGVKYYDIINPVGGYTPRVREDELLSAE